MSRTISRTRSGRAALQTCRTRATTLLALIALALAACSAGESVANSGSAGSAVPRETASSTLLPGPGGTLRWSAIHLDSPGGSVMSLASNGSLVVVLLSGEERTIWSTVDGESWQRETTLDADAYPQSVAAAPDGFLVVGGSGEASLGYWTSPDGHTWSQADLAGWTSTMLGAAVGADGTRVFVTGCIAPKPASAEGLCGGTLKNGTWTTFDDPDLDGGVFGAVAAGPNGFLVVGQDRSTAASPGATWTSRDGLAWEKTTDGAMRNFMPLGVVAVSDGWITVGSLRTATGFSPAALHSRDGRSWTAMGDASAAIGAAASPPTTTSSGMLRGIVELADGTVIVAGVAYLPSGSSQVARGVMLRWAPGGRWTVVPEVYGPSGVMPAGSSELSAAAIVGSHVVVGGSDQDGPLLWVGQPAS